MLRFGLSIHVHGAYPDDILFEMSTGTDASRALQYFDSCRAPLDGSILLVEVGGIGKVRRILAHESGVCRRAA